VNLEPQVRAGTISTNDFKVGTNVEVDNAPWKVRTRPLNPRPRILNPRPYVLNPKP